MNPPVSEDGSQTTPKYADFAPNNCNIPTPRREREWERERERECECEREREFERESV